MQRTRSITELPLASGDPLWPLEWIDPRFEPHDPLFDGEHEEERPHRRRRRKQVARGGVVSCLAALLALSASACGDSDQDAGPRPIALHTTDSVLVQLAPGGALPAPGRDDGGPPIVALAAVGPDDAPPLLRVPVPAGLDAADRARRLALQPGVAFAEPVYLYRTQRTPSDPRFKDLWGMRRIGAPDAWAQTTGDRKVVVAVVDDGVALAHPDLKGNLWNNPGELEANGADDDGDGFVDDGHGVDLVDGGGDPSPAKLGNGRWHGSHVAGIIGAVGDNRLGVAGVSWNVSLMAVRAIGRDGGRSDVLAQAIDYAVDHGARVINASWGGGGQSLALRNAIVRAGRRGVLVVAAAGNEGAALPDFPASLALDNLLSVGATGPDDRLAAFSNRGALVAAPGVGILSTTAPGQYERYDGTSMAAPHVAGLAALLWAFRPAASAAQIRRAILDSAVAAEGVEHGRIDAARALSLLESRGSAAGALVLSQRALSFRAAPGRLPRAQTIALRSEGGGAPRGWTARSDGRWLLLSSDRGETPSHVSIRVDPSRLPAGEHVARVVFADASGASVALEVSARAGSPSAVVVDGSGCSMKSGVLHARAGSACTLALEGVERAPGVRWRLPGGDVSAGARLHAWFVRRGTFVLQVSADEGEVDPLQAVVE